MPYKTTEACVCRVCVCVCVCVCVVCDVNVGIQNKKYPFEISIFNQLHLSFLNVFFMDL